MRRRLWTIFRKSKLGLWQCASAITYCLFQCIFEADKRKLGREGDQQLSQAAGPGMNINKDMMTFFNRIQLIFITISIKTNTIK